jgi:glycerol-3-phosphate dehydrogenase subunit C
MSVIARAPHEPPATTPHDPRYWDARDLERELRRAFQICHECRMCVGYCGSFPELFSRVDRDIESGRSEGAEHLDYDDIKAVGDACWQCKLCYIKCPYTPDEGASELLDFPRLMQRERAVRAKREGIPLVDKLLGEPQLLGQLASGPMAKLANAGPKLLAASALLKKVQEKATGISAEFPLPTFADEPFSAWLTKAGEAALGSGEHGEVVLFATCYGEYNTPAIARAALRVLAHNGVRVHVPGVASDLLDAHTLTCCGMPNLDGGDVAAATAKVKHNVALLAPHVAKGRKVVVLGPTCGYTMKREWAELVPTSDARAVAGATVDLMEHLVSMAREKKLSREWKTEGLGTVAYHAACHLRAQKVGTPGARLLGLVPNSDVRVIEQCSAVDGTWGMKAAHYEEGRKYAARLVREVRELEPDLVVSDCTLAGLRVWKENGLPVIHPVEALLRAYGLDDERAERA